MSYRCPSFLVISTIAAAGSAAGIMVAWGMSAYIKDISFMIPLAAGWLSAMAVMLAVGSAIIMPSLKQCRASFSKMSVMSKVFEASNEAVVITDQDNRIRDINAAFTQITGYEKQDAIGKDPGFMKSDRQDPEFYKQMWEDIKTTGSWQGEIWDIRKNGELYPKWLTISTMKDSKNRIRKHIGVFSDISTVKESEELHEFLAHYDNLTRLPNRTLFNDRLRQAMAKADSTDTLVAVLIIDLDRFKYINEAIGHSAGDIMLKAAGERIKGCIRDSDTAARLGADEFAVILTGVTSKKISISVAKKIIEAMHQPVMAKHHEMRSTASIGITIYPIDGDKPNLLLKNAEMAMEYAKDAGHNTYRVFTDKMREKLNERIRVESNLRQAIERDELVLHYQPQVDLKTGKTTGMEALIRRQESDWLVPPGVFIPIAEETGLIMDIADWTLNEACSQVKAWIDEGLPPTPVAVNISATHFNSPNFVRDIANVLTATGLPPELLEIELTERVIMHQASEVTQKINELKEMGLFLSIDDFGTGYSSLSYLKHFKVDKLKIDYSFVKDISDGPTSGGATIVRAIISLAHNLGFKVIAEGVEKKEQLDFLIKEGCDEVQGFYFSFPLPADKFHQLLKSNKKLPLSPTAKD